jgi:hypothetical protein
MSECPYDTTVYPDDTRRALATISATLVPNAKSPVLVRLSGSCPRCEHRTADKHAIVAWAGLDELGDDALFDLSVALIDQGQPRGTGDEEFVSSCRCDHQHPGRPSGAVGCGSRFTVRVVWP